MAMQQTIPTTITTEQADLDRLVLDLAPRQGNWSDEAYLRLTDHTSHLIEFTDGFVEVLPMPTDRHQTILGYLYHLFLARVHPAGGKVQFAALRLRIRPGKYREPDILLLRDARDERRQDRYWLGADLVVEVVSPDKPARDLVDKRRDYAEGRVPEYWIVNPGDETILVLRLEGDAYVEHGTFRRGQAATSSLLSGFAVEVSAVFDAD